MWTPSRLWYGDDLAARCARSVLWPVERLFRAGVAVRNAMYDRGLIQAQPTAIPVVAVGNLTVGGTGKTPIAAWIAAELRTRGAHPAVVLRGYGGDEAEVHRHLNPAIPVIVSPKRMNGIDRSRALGTDVAVLDDAFQHRAAARVADIVLVSAERGVEHVRLLPAGPFREPVSALGRASLVMVTRKSASLQSARTTLAAACALSDRPGALVHLLPNALLSLQDGAIHPLSDIHGQRITVITGIAEPERLADQLRALGAAVDLHAFADHDPFADKELRRIAAAVPPGGLAVCTLKDAVKIAARWPGTGPLWYVSQRVVVEQGQEMLDQVFAAVLSARHLVPSTAG